MGSKLITDIPKKCMYCEDKAEYFYINWGFWNGLQTRFLCEKHKNEITNKEFLK